MDKEVIGHLANINKELAIINEMLIEKLPLGSEWEFDITGVEGRFMNDIYTKDNFITLKIVPNDDKPKTLNQMREEFGLPRIEDTDDPNLTELQSIHKILKELKDNLLGESDD